MSASGSPPNPPPSEDRVYNGRPRMTTQEMSEQLIALAQSLHDLRIHVRRDLDPSYNEQFPLGPRPTLSSRVGPTQEPNAENLRSNGLHGQCPGDR